MSMPEDIIEVEPPILETEPLVPVEAKEELEFETPVDETPEVVEDVFATPVEGKIDEEPPQVDPIQTSHDETETFDVSGDMAEPPSDEDSSVDVEEGVIETKEIPALEMSEDEVARIEEASSVDDAPLVEQDAVLVKEGNADEMVDVEESLAEAIVQKTVKVLRGIN